MNHFGKFYALSAIYFGLASAVGAQPVSASSDATVTATEGAAQEHFQHPLLERHGSNDVRPAQEQGQRIQRRGMQDTRQDGEIQRNPLPGAGDVYDEETIQERDAREQRRTPD